MSAPGIVCKVHRAPVTAVSTLIVPADPNRKYLAIRNVGPNRMWFDMDEDAAANTCWLLEPGEGYEWPKDLTPLNELRGISANGTTLVWMVG